MLFLCTSYQFHENPNTYIPFLKSNIDEFKQNHLRQTSSYNTGWREYKLSKYSCTRFSFLQQYKRSFSQLLTGETG